MIVMVCILGIWGANRSDIFVAFLTFYLTVLMITQYIEHHMPTVVINSTVVFSANFLVIPPPPGEGMM